MTENYLNIHAVSRQPVVLHPKRVRLILLSSVTLFFGLYVTYLLTTNRAADNIVVATVVEPLPTAAPTRNDLPPIGARVDSVATVVTKALYFKSLLSTTQQATLQQTYTTTLARKWSNLPCGSGCRNGIQFSALTSVQLAAALDVIRAASGTGTDDGYAEFNQVRKADAYLKTNGGGSGYDSTIYFISFLNTPSTSTGWMLQYGGHHYAANIAYNGGKVIGSSPVFMGVEPTSFTMNSVTYTPLKQEHDSFAVMLAGLTASQLASAKLTNTYSDCLLSPGESNGNTNTFPTTKAGLRANVLTTAQKSAIFAAIRNYTADLDDSIAAVIQSVYEADIDNTYIAWTGSSTAGSSSTFLNANTNYVRLDGTRLWIEFICQTGVVFQSQIHYHTVYRDHNNDYGVDLTATTLPVTLLSFDAVAQGKGRLLNWQTANETRMAYFEIQRSENIANGFAAIAKVGASNSTRNAYTYTDNGSVNESVLYYRLKMVDADGHIEYSNIVVVKYSIPATGISIYPNPVQNIITISSAENVQNGTITVINSAGKILLRNTNQSGRNLNVDVSNLPAGPYLVQLLSNGKTTTIKFVKQK